MTALLLVTWNDDNNYTQLNTDFSFSTIVNVVYILYIVEYTDRNLSNNVHV